MLVPQELMNCVVFIGYEGVAEDQIEATGFLVSVQGGVGNSYIYLVTAAHCVANIDTGEVYDGLFLRVNDPDTGTTLPVTLPSVRATSQEAVRWYLHPQLNPLRQMEEGDPISDLAVIPIDRPEWLLDRGYRWIPLSMFFDEATLSDKASEGVGVGDEVVSIGLLTVHKGTLRNEPIIRTGNIAMIPREPVVSAKSSPQELYLIEARSVGGLSGSPVFVRHRAPLIAPQVPMSLFGVLSSHWSDQVPMDKRMHDGGPLNMGIARVVPARQLLEVLNQESLLKLRKHSDAVRLAKDGPEVELDRASTPKQPSYTQADFMDDLRKVTRPEAQPETEA